MSVGFASLHSSISISVPSVNECRGLGPTFSTPNTATRTEPSAGCEPSRPGGMLLREGGGVIMLMSGMLMRAVSPRGLQRPCTHSYSCMNDLLFDATVPWIFMLDRHPLQPSGECSSIPFRRSHESGRYIVHPFVDKIQRRLRLRLRLRLAKSSPNHNPFSHSLYQAD